ncbi:MAG: ABC transporter permease [Alistipes sp.]|nr:ABC transporter permease [Alistipes sp.]
MARSTEGHRPSVMERIAVISVAISVGVMILSLAVVFGFKREIAANMSGFSAHAVVTDVRGVHRVDAEPILVTESLDSLLRADAGVVHLQRYARRGGVVRTSEAVEGVLLKGVGAEYDWSHLAEWLVEGELPRVGDSIRTKDVLLSKRLAERLAVGPGDRIELLFVEPDELPYRDRFKVSGLYASGMEEMDYALLITDIRNVQRLSQWDENQISGYEIHARSLAEGREVAARIDYALLYDEGVDADNVTAVAVEELYPQVFDWLKAHDVNAVVILLIMLVVAFFNMSVALMILVLERIRMIGVLKALGMQHRSLRKIFLYRAGLIAARGLVWGNVVALTLCWLQATFHLLKLDAEGYMLSAVPIAWDWGWWLLLNAGFAVAILALMWLPASVVATVKPDESMRYE